MAITNAKLAGYQFLPDVYRDGYFPDLATLIQLCEQIESDEPAGLDDSYKLTHAATEAFNELQEEFYSNESEFEPLPETASAQTSKSSPRRMFMPMLMLKSCCATRLVVCPRNSIDDGKSLHRPSLEKDEGFWQLFAIALRWIIRSICRFVKLRSEEEYAADYLPDASNAQTYRC